jgi:hypothetical protein
MRFLHLIRPVMCVLPEVASPDRKVSIKPAMLNLVTAGSFIACTYNHVILASPSVNEPPPHHANVHLH